MSTFLLSMLYGAVFLTSAKLNEFAKNNATWLREYIRLAVLVTGLSFFVAWSASVLARYSAMAEQLLHVFTLFVLAAVWLLIDYWRQLFTLFSKPGDERSVITAMLELVVPLSIASIVVPSVRGDMIYGLMKVLIFLVCLGLFSFILTGFRRQFAQLLPVSLRRNWVHYSWTVFGCLMIVVTLALAVSRAPALYGELAQWGGALEATGKALIGLLLHADLIFRAFY
ncbi:hypothetical protein SAMN05216203_0177 [Marinobacter daqiaonensis]|uniref:Uncharacterized protein n=1 Tax=Marinobacter daqiaonensis TaxID=650891 RepID=A0A1I6GJL8_9GAMM|nr:hypothetical protein [Marinobacter daqiaonensis]SFR42394.1 hypothetical protein SAMN05216203_0177 [Marinobacter daqiaonensis]